MTDLDTKLNLGIASVLAFAGYTFGEPLPTTAERVRKLAGEMSLTAPANLDDLKNGWAMSASLLAVDPQAVLDYMQLHAAGHVATTYEIFAIQKRMVSFTEVMDPLLKLRAQLGEGSIAAQQLRLQAYAIGCDLIEPFDEARKLTEYLQNRLKAIGDSTATFAHEFESRFKTYGAEPAAIALFASERMRALLPEMESRGQVATRILSELESCDTGTAA